METNADVLVKRLVNCLDHWARTNQLVHLKAVLRVKILRSAVDARDMASDTEGSSLFLLRIMIDLYNIRAIERGFSAACFSRKFGRCCIDPRKCREELGVIV